MINSGEFIEALHAGRQLPYYDAEDLDDLAYDLLNQMQLPEARAAIELCERTHPEYEDIKIARIRLLIGTGQAQEALQLLDSLTTCSLPYERDLLRVHCLLLLGKKKTAQALLESIPEQYGMGKGTDSYNPEDICMDLSDVCLDCKYPEGRQYILEWGAQQCPKSEAILEDLADYYAHSKQQEKALPVLRQLTSINALDVENWRHLSLVCSDLERWEDALEAANYALAIQPHDEALLMQKTHCLYNLSRWQQAMECANAYLALMPKPGEEGMTAVRFSGICLAKGLLIDCYNSLKMYPQAQQTYNDLLRLLE